jgi:hypothetical protein
MRWMAHWRACSSSDPTLGAYLDPVADKLLLSTLFLVLFYKGLMPVTVTVLVFGRDVGILLVSALLYAAVGRREFSSQHLRQGQHSCPDQRGGGRSAAAGHAGMALGRGSTPWRSMPPSRLPSSRVCIMRGWFRAAAGPPPANGAAAK